MARRASSLSFVANVFWLAFALDAVLSLSDDLLSLALGGSPLGTPRLIVSLFVIAVSVPVFAVAVVTPRLPRTAFLPMLLFVPWAALGAMPVAAWVGDAALPVTLASLQSLVAAWAGFVARRRCGRWLWHEDDLPATRFRPGHVFGMLALTFLLVPALALCAASRVALGVERFTAGFVHFGAFSIDITERRYERDGQVVHLVGMMHVGEGQVYRELFASFRGPSTVILEEGVSDEQGLLTRGPIYDRFASRIGLDSQPSLEEILAEWRDEDSGQQPPDVVNADVDASLFQEETLELLNLVLAIYRSDDPAGVLGEFQRFLASRDAEKLLELVQTDLIDLRNANVLRELDRALPVYERVVIPWGALHLPGIEREVIARGFARVSESRRSLVAYRTLLP